MIGKLVGACCVFAVVALVFAFGNSTNAQQPAAPPAQPMITGPVVEPNFVTLSGNTRPEANAANDRGRVADSFPMEHMLLQLRRAAAQEQRVTQLIDQLHDPASPDFHKWLTPTQFGALATSWTIVGTSFGSGDFKGDGYSGVLWRDTSGNAAIWEMNGTTVLNPNTAGVGNLPTAWTIQNPLGR